MNFKFTFKYKGRLFNMNMRNMNLWIREKHKNDGHKFTLLSAKIV